MGGLPNNPEWTNFNFFQQFPAQNLNKKGVQFMKKLPTHVFWAPQCGPFWTNGSVCQSAQMGPNWTDFFNNG